MRTSGMVQSSCAVNVRVPSPINKSRATRYQGSAWIIPTRPTERISHCRVCRRHARIAVYPIGSGACVMAKKTVLAVGIEPALADYAMLPGLTPELIRNYLDAQIGRLRARLRTRGLPDRSRRDRRAGGDCGAAVEKNLTAS